MSRTFSEQPPTILHSPDVTDLRMCMPNLASWPESVQKLAVCVIYWNITSSDYQMLLSISGIDTLEDKREVLCERLFKRHVLPSDSVLHCLLPD